jgi:hypothetical protein
LEIVNGLLEEYPTHLECLTFKALVHNQLKDHEKALVWVNKALLLNFSSSASWHVFAIIKKGQKDYIGAKAAYI